MKFSFNSVLGSVASAGVAGVLLFALTGCGADVLTWSQDAKRDGIQQYNDGRYAEATGSFRNAIRQNPIDPESEYWLALSYEQTHSYHGAIDAYKTSLQLMPPPGTAHYNQAMHDIAFDRLARVVAKYDSTGSETDLIVKSAAADQSSEEYRLLGRICRYRGDADSALDNYRLAVKLSPDHFVAQRELGLYLAQLAQNQEAGQVLRDAYRLNQDDRYVNAALRRIGMEPGPGLLVAQHQSAQPLLPDPATVDPGLTTPASDSDGPSPDMAAPKD